MPPDPEYNPAVASVEHSADERAFLQQRVVLYCRVAAAIIALFFVVDLVLHPILVSRLGVAPAAKAQHRGLLVEMISTALLVGTSFLAARMSATKPTLYVIDGIATLLVCTALSSIIWDAPWVPFPMELMLLICVQTLLFVHAALVPAPAVRTALMHTLACLPLFFIARDRAIEAHGDIWSWMSVYSILGWAIILAAVGAVMSRLLYRLEVRFRAALRLGQYQLEERLGEGAMGIVYKARHGMLRRPTAVKVLPPDLAGSRAIARFEREVRQTSRLTHPNTVAIYDFGRTPEGVFYYAMELLDGLNLARIVELSGPFGAARTIHVMRQCAGALAEAHALELVHRDVKPENIILCRRGGVPDTVKVVDFGLVKDLEAPTDVQLSHQETLLGTPLYMPPESITGEGTLDGRADLYSLGAVGYFLLTGRPPFEGKTVVQVCADHLNTTPTKPSVRLGKPVPSDLEAIVMKLLEKRPDDRFASALDLEEALLDCRDHDDWRRHHAEDWWQDHHSQIETMRKGEPLPRGRALTIQVDRS